MWVCRGVCSWKTKACLWLRHDMDEVEKLKALLSHCSCIIQIPNRRSGKNRDVSQIRCDQSELYTTAATVNAVSFLGTSGSGNILVQLGFWRGDRVKGEPTLICWQAPVSGIPLPPVSVPYYERLADIWASPASFQLLDWPRPSIWKWYQSGAMKMWLSHGNNVVITLTQLRVCHNWKALNTSVLEEDCGE